MSTETKMYVGDIGTVWQIDVSEDVTDADTLEFLVKKPDGTEVTWTATLDADDHTLLYTIGSGDYDQAGEYRAHAFITYSNGDQWLGERFYFKVYAKWY